MAATVFVFLIRPSVKRGVLLLGSAALLITCVAAFDLRVVIPGTSREFSIDQLSQSVVSIFSNGEHTELENTKAWRLAWWNKIWGYTAEGPYFWTGKGYGVNLAESDGFPAGTRDEPLRSPHNSHLTFLARSGIPGFVLWIALQLTWAIGLVRAYILAARNNLHECAMVFAWILAYWIAFMVCAAFDVFLEGPMAGIPFWTLFGLGWGAKELFYAKVRERELTA
jgi:O-antigen ligase